MHIITPYDSGAFLKRSNGTWQFYESRRQLFTALGWNVLRRCGRPGAWFFGWQTVVKDIDGNRLTARVFEVFATPKELRKAERQSHPIGTGAVPGTGVRGRGNSMRRCLKTTQERRLHAFFDTDAGEPKPRARRTGSNLASAFDDQIRSDAGARNWKHYRKHQWKA
jgi:hypothetical protein